MPFPPQRLDATHDIIYQAKHPLYEFALDRSALACRDPRSQPSLVQLRFTGQPQQQDITLPLAALEPFHDALSRLIDYIKQERGRQRSTLASGSAIEVALAACEQLDDGINAAPSEASPPPADLNRPLSGTTLWRLSGIIVMWLIALLSWALYSLWTSTGDFRPMQATAAQESYSPPAATAMARSDDEARESPMRSVAGQPPSSLSSPTAKVHGDQPPHISVHIQSPAQRETAQHLADRLQQHGYLIAKTAILVRKGPPRTEVRYFHSEEAEEAAAIAVLLHQPYRPPATLNYRRGRRDGLQSSHRRYEVWLGPEPRSGRTAQ